MDDSLIRKYLVAYNAFCYAIWALVLLQTAATPTIVSCAALREVWFERVGPEVKFAMMVALLEIVHATFRFTKSDPITTAMQVLSRLHVCVLIWGLAPQTTTAFATILIIIAWTAAELVRYPFYICNLLTSEVPYWLKWSRYSAFIILYPLGISGEMLAMAQGIQVFKKDDKFQHWPTPMPNRMNFEISLSLVYTVVMCLYIPGSVHMYRHMLAQRKKALSGAAVEKKNE